MWRLRTLLLLCSCVSRATGVMEVFGFLGRDVNVSCQYDAGYESYDKYLCKNNCGNDDVLIATPQTTSGRFSISDERKILTFVVTITNLTSSDAGKYWCGVSRAGKDLYVEVKLKITPDTCCSNVVEIQRHEEDAASIACPYAAKHQRNVKFVCRGNRPSTCLQRAVVTSETMPSGRFTINDDQTSKKFTATISGLTREDSGPYLCGVQSSGGLQGFSAFHLKVKEWCCVRSSNVSGAEGSAATLHCPYPPPHRENRKFLCKGDHRSRCTNVVSNGSRFALQDNETSGSFSVTVSRLEAGDSGTYWCGSDPRWTVANYTKVELSVFLQHDTVIRTVTVTIIVVAFSLIAVLLTLLYTCVIRRHKCHKKQAGVLAVTNVPKRVEEETRPDVYINQEFVRQAQQSSSYQYHDVDEEQPEYENLARTEELYCNQGVKRANMY